ncbi:MAG: collagen-binding domain-containing protein [Burkholderiaceae bacterium]
MLFRLTAASGLLLGRAAAFAFLATALGSASAAPIDLGIAGGFNLFALGDVAIRNTEVRGAVAAGGALQAQNFNINGAAAAGAARQSLVVGGDATLRSGQLGAGDAYVGGQRSVSGIGFAGAFTSGAAPFSFEQAGTELLSLSALLSAIEPNAAVRFDPWGGAVFAGGSGGAGGPAALVFGVSGDQLLRLNRIDFEGLTAGQTLIINVSGATAGLRNVDLSGFQPYNVLFNFFDAKDLLLTGIGLHGSILAPQATVSGGSGRIAGNVIVDQWNSSLALGDGGYFRAADVGPAAAGPGAGSGIGTDTGSETRIAIASPFALILLGAAALLLMPRLRRRTPQA